MLCSKKAITPLGFEGISGRHGLGIACRMPESSADVFLNGTVSEVALRRSEYSSVLKRDGVEKLFSVVERKIDDLKKDAS